jgi:hypothetical protein
MPKGCCWEQFGNGSPQQALRNPLAPRWQNNNSRGAHIRRQTGHV